MPDVSIHLDLPISQLGWALLCAHDTVIFLTRDEAEKARRTADACSPECRPHILQPVKSGTGMRFLRIEED